MEKQEHKNWHSTVMVSLLVCFGLTWQISYHNMACLCGQGSFLKVSPQLTLLKAIPFLLVVGL